MWYKADVPQPSSYIHSRSIDQSSSPSQPTRRRGQDQIEQG
jgi:hypothetical protein